MIKPTWGPKGMYLLEYGDPEFIIAWKLLDRAGYQRDDYRYMHSTPTAHYFKHIDTRVYAVIPKEEAPKRGTEEVPGLPE